jgi:hypothetical protein
VGLGRPRGSGGADARGKTSKTLLFGKPYLAKSDSSFSLGDFGFSSSRRETKFERRNGPSALLVKRGRVNSNGRRQGYFNNGQ